MSAEKTASTLSKNTGISMPTIKYRQAVKALKYGQHEHWVLKLKLNDKTVFALIDTGCNASAVIGPQLFAELGLASQSQQNKAGTAGGHAGYKVIKSCTMTIAERSLVLKDAITMEMENVFTKKYQCIIGLPILKKLRVVLDIHGRKILFK